MKRAFFVLTGKLPSELREVTGIVISSLQLILKIAAMYGLFRGAYL